MKYWCFCSFEFSSDGYHFQRLLPYMEIWELHLWELWGITNAFDYIIHFPAGPRIHWLALIPQSFLFISGHWRYLSIALNFKEYISSTVTDSCARTYCKKVIFHCITFYFSMLRNLLNLYSVMYSEHFFLFFVIF